MLFIASHNNQVIGSPMIADTKEQAIKILQKTAKDMRNNVSSSIKEFEAHPQVVEINNKINGCKAGIEKGKEAKDKETKETIAQLKVFIKQFEAEKKKLLKRYIDVKKVWTFKDEELKFYVIPEYLGK